MSSEVPWAEERYEYDASNNLTRMGKHKSPGTQNSNAGWYIWKFTYDVNNNLTSKTGPVIGVWST